jgi:hypothetical protein
MKAIQQNVTVLQTFLACDARSLDQALQNFPPLGADSGLEAELVRLVSD